MRMKPVPKAILVILVVSAAGYGINSYLDYRKVNAPITVAPIQAPEVIQAPAHGQPLNQTPTQEAAAVRAAEAVSAAKAAATPQDRGLNNLLGK